MAGTFPQLTISPSGGSWCHFNGFSQRWEFLYVRKQHIDKMESAWKMWKESKVAIEELCTTDCEHNFCWTFGPTLYQSSCRAGPEFHFVQFRIPDF